MPRRIEDFFALEARGWKGKAGTAAALHDDIRGFISAAVGGLAAAGKVAVNRIFIDGRAIAVTITLRSADTAWFWKIAYDENFAHYSPGVVLTLRGHRRPRRGRQRSCAPIPAPPPIIR